jgi:hypothetical protein
VRLAEPVVARRGDRFILRTAGGDATLGGGTVLDAHPLKHRRHRLDAAEALERIAAGGLEAAIAHELAKAAAPVRVSFLARQLAETRAAIEAACKGTFCFSSAGLAPPDLASTHPPTEGNPNEAGRRKAECPPMPTLPGPLAEANRGTFSFPGGENEAPPLADGVASAGRRDADDAGKAECPLFVVPSKGDAWVYNPETLAALRERVVAALAEHHKAKPLLATGIGAGALALRLDPQRTLSDDIVSAMMEALVAEGTLRRVADTFALAAHRVALSESQVALRAAILDACRSQPFSPPTEADLEGTLPFPARETAAVYEALLRSGELVDCELCGFHPEAVEQAWERLEAHLHQHGPITMGEFRELLGTTRRYAMALMHHFDTTGRVVRDGDFRRLG